MVDAPTAVRALAAFFGRGAIGMRATRVFPGARPHLASDERRILQAQVRLAFDNLNACLSAAGSTFDDVVDVTIVVVDPPSISTRSGRSRPATGATRRIRRRPASA
ncbi:endoribonuclease L-PSP family protein [Burkholderia pseudomallei MSHR7498]|nr:Rid family hydrolase [Burkholderia pseudomallei]KGS91947.1 endoribonuclease L-PSP family protein [Burkholderia pseudomallei MSHR7498]